MKHVYLDHNASTPIAPEVAEAMRPFLAAAFGNPSSPHWAGAPAKAALERARAQVAKLLGCDPREIVFTSGGSEANNHAIKGSFFARRARGDHIVTTQAEHPAVLQPCRFLEQLGATVTLVPVDGAGRVDPEDIRRALTPRTVLVSVMHANNEVGTIQPLAEIARVCGEHGVPLHTDAAQTVGKIPTRVHELGVDLLTVVGHKFHAPKGVGALYIRDGLRIEPLVHGGGHEGARRAGTENVLLAVGLGAACELAGAGLDARAAHWQQLRDHFHTGLVEIFGNGVRLNGHPSFRLPNTLNVSFVGRLGSDVLGSLDGVAASTGSACHSGRHELSPVLKAMGVDEAAGLGAVRFSLGRGTTRAELDHVLTLLRPVGRAPAVFPMNPQPGQIDSETLRQWLTDGRRVTVLDIRKPEDRAEWSIPGSVHVAAYDALKARDPNALADVALPADEPVITVCGAGKVARIAAGQLQARGVRAMVLDGGMKDWSRAWNTADVPLAGSKAQVVQVRRTGKGCLSYMIASESEAAVLDASLEPEVYLRIAADHGWVITHVLDTHVHADHLSRSRVLAAAAGAKLHLPDQKRVAFPFAPVRDGDEIRIGAVALKALHTPGHTLESTSFLLAGQALFTGDTLFLSGVGRPDLGADPTRARERAVMLHHSLQRLLRLDPGTLVLPGHHSQPIAFDGKPMLTTLHELRAGVPALAETEAGFVEWILGRIPPTPANYLEIVKHNEAGEMPAGNPTDLEAGANRCAVS